MLSDVRKKQLDKYCGIIFWGIPTGTNEFSDNPIRGNKALAQVVYNRIESITKLPDEVKYMVDKITQEIKKTKGAVVSKIKMDKPSALTDSKGFLIKKEK